MRSLSRSRARIVALVSLLSVSVIALAVGGAASGSTASRSLIAIHEQGTNPQTRQGIFAVRGKFTIELRKAPFGPGGTTAIYGAIGATRNVNGQEQIPLLAGSDILTSKTGKIVLAFSGTHLELNSKLSPSGFIEGPKAEYGTWKIKTATGAYQGWKGGGNWASVAYGYGNVQPYSAEWDGYVVTPTG